MWSDFARGEKSLLASSPFKSRQAQGVTSYDDVLVILSCSSCLYKTAEEHRSAANGPKKDCAY